MLYWITIFLLKILSFIFFPVRCYGLEHIPRKGSFILASNHLSNLDPPLLGCLIPRRMNFLAKDSLFGSALAGFFLRQLGAIPIRRESSDIRALRAALKLLRRKQPLVIFPEGARAGSKSGLKREGPAYLGIGFLAVKSAVPVIPVKIIGTSRVLPPGGNKLRRRHVKVIIGRPLDFSQKKDYEAVARDIMKEINSLPSWAKSSPKFRAPKRNKKKAS